MGVIYLRTNLINGKKYVGQTQNFKNREYAWNCLKYRYGNQLLTHDREAYGLDNFTVDIIKECDNNSELDAWEKHFIKELDTQYPNGYNCDEGGSIGFHHSEETKQKISKAKKGIPTSDETKKKLSEAKKGIPRSEETKQKISETQKGIPKSEETKHKMSQAKKGRGNPNFGKFGKDNPTSKAVVQLTKDGEFVRKWDSMMDVERQLGYAHISECCKGKQKTCGGYKWVYEEDYIEKLLGKTA